MVLLAFKYAYLNSKARTLYAMRLKDSDWHILKDAANQKTFLEYLSTTPYGPYISTLLKNPIYAKTFLKKRLFKRLFSHYKKMALALKDKKEKEVILALFSRFEAENIKLVLRTLHSGLKSSEITHLIYPVETLSKLPWEKLWECTSIKDMLPLLFGSVFYVPFKNALYQYKAQGRTLPLEMAMELASFSHIRKTILALKEKFDQKRVMEITGSYIDILNIMHIARLRLIYNLSPEEAFNYSYEGGYYLNLKSLHALSKADNISSLKKTIPVSIKKGLDKDISDLQSLNKSLLKWYEKRLKASFLGYPFHLGVAVALLIFEEIELKKLISLFELKGFEAQMTGGQNIVQASQAL